MSALLYQIRVRVEGGRYFTVQLPAPTGLPSEQHGRPSLPNFIDLFNVIQDAAKDLHLHEYQISTALNDYTLTNDDTLHRWLIQSSNNLITRDLVLLHRSINSKQATLQKQQESSGIVKRTVVRWSDHHHSPSDSVRKDSGVGLSVERQRDGRPYHVKKKQRLNSPDISFRQLPEPHSRQQPMTAATASPPVHMVTPSTTLAPIINSPLCPHPTTAASSSSSSPPPTLPALASITSSTVSLYSHVNNRTALLSVPSPTSSFVCDKRMSDGHHCNQTFRRSYDLQRHQTIHLRNRPYSYCSQCGKKFTRIDALRRHERVQGHCS